MPWFSKNRVGSLKAVAIFLLLASGELKAQAYKDPDLPVEERVEDLVSRMTLTEKTRQLQCMIFQEVLEENTIGENGIGGFAHIRIDIPAGIKEEVEQRNRIQKYLMEETRLGIPGLFHAEALHGLVAKGNTSFPQAIGLAATFNTELMAQVSHAIATETKTRGFRQVLSPTVDIARDKRWGRVAETYGEDPFLTSEMAVAFCKSFEDLGIVTTPKHFVANSGEGGRDSHPVHYSERILREVFFPPYKAAVQRAGSRGIMASYNALDGIPSGTNRWLLTDILREEWGFNGIVVTDYKLIGVLWKQQLVAENSQQAAAKALKAGLDRDLPRIGNDNGFKDLDLALKEGLIREEDIDRAVKRVLKLKFELGLFENPYGDPNTVEQITNNDAHKNLALEAARQSIVLLKNKEQTLPLEKNLSKIVVIGEDANKPKLGDYTPWGIENECTTILEGIQTTVSEKTGVVYLPVFGADVQNNLIHAPNGKPFTINFYENTSLEGQSVYSKTYDNINFNWGNRGPTKELRGKPFAMRLTGEIKGPKTGSIPMTLNIEGGARLIIGGKKIWDNYNDPYKTVFQFVYDLKEGEAYDIVLEYNSLKYYSNCQLTWDLSPGNERDGQQLESQLMGADAVIIVGGVVEKEGSDRSNLDLPGSLEEVIRKVGGTGIPTTVVFTSGSAITMNEWFNHADAIVQAWYPGQEGGTAVAEVLWGDYNPAGRLPITYVQTVGQSPMYYNFKPSGRGYGYVDMSGEPRFTFGHGLSYTSFEYRNLKLSKNTIEKDGSADVSLDVTNTGEMTGDEVVQLYVHDKIASVVRPVKELKGFKRISLRPGETKTVQFTLTPGHLSMYNDKMEYVVEPGEFEIMIGKSSDDIVLRKVLTVN